jgi:hypothetical protein
MVLVLVGAHPDPGWERLGWRLRALAMACANSLWSGPED